MTLTKAPKEKSSTQKFWKKFSLNKNKTSSSGVGPEQQQVDIDDDKSVKSKRLSGLLVSRKQSMASLRKQHSQLPLGVADTEKQQQQHPAVPPLSVSLQQQQHQQHPSRPPTPPPGAELDVDDKTTMHGSEKDPKEQETIIAEHVNAPSKSDPDPVPNHGSSPGVAERKQEQPAPAPTSDNNASAPAAPVKALRTPRQRTNSNSNAPSRLVPPKTISVEKQKSSQTAASADRLPRPTTNKSTQSTSSSLSTSSSSGTRQSPPSSRIRKPSQIPAIRNGSGAVSNKSSQSSLPKENVTAKADLHSGGDHQTVIKELQEELEKERSVVKVLQGQKEAITKDLDYFSQMMDELMEEKDSLQQKYDSLQKAYDQEKQISQTREEDLNVLLEKLKMSNENAREKSFEYDKFKGELENLQQQLEEERENFKSRLKDKDSVISRLKNELAQAHEENKVLKNTMDHMIKAQAAHTQNPSNASSPKPSKSSHPHAQDTRQNSSDDQSSSFGPQSPIPGPANLHHSFAPPQAVPTQPRSNVEYGYDTPQSSVNSDHSINEQQPFSLKADDLDNQLMRLTKEKEKLQSDYSKIPLSGGGPMSRRRKEELEEMLDEVDSQLSRVKQKIRRS